MENRCRILSKIKYCGLCGKKIWMQNYNTQNRIAHIMVRDGVCYECAYWEDLIAYPPEYMEVVNHKCLRLHPVADKKDKTLILGGKGKMRYFMRTDGSLIQSNDIWVIGTIPDRFSSQLPTSAVEITLKAYRQLKKSNKKCQARACLDRYHCFRYNRALENDERGPFNTVPPKWNVGDEHCGFFINLQDIKRGPFNTVPPKWNVGDEHCGFFINLQDIKSDESSIISKPNSNETKN